MLEDERQKFKEKVLRAKSTDRVMLLKKFVDENLSDLKTKKEKIIFLGKMFGWARGHPGVSCWIIDEAVGCSHGYAKAFLRASSGEIVESGRRRRTLTPLTKQKVLERDNWRCVRCGAKKDLNIHHIIPHVDFSFDDEKVNDLENLVPLCKRCHAATLKGGFTIYRATKAGFWKWVLKSVPGIGRVRARSFYRAGYRTRRDLRGASVDELAKVPHVGLETAKKIKRQIVLATVR